MNHDNKERHKVGIQTTRTYSMMDDVDVRHREGEITADLAHTCISHSYVHLLTYNQTNQ